MFIITHLHANKRVYANKFYGTCDWNFTNFKEKARKLPLKDIRFKVRLAKKEFEDNFWVEDIKIQFVQ